MVAAAEFNRTIVPLNKTCTIFGCASHDVMISTSCLASSQQLTGRDREREKHSTVDPGPKSGERKRYKLIFNWTKASRLVFLPPPSSFSPHCQVALQATQPSVILGLRRERSTRGKINFTCKNNHRQDIFKTRKNVDSSISFLSRKPLRCPVFSRVSPTVVDFHPALVSSRMQFWIGVCCFLVDGQTVTYFHLNSQIVASCHISSLCTC